MFSGFTNMCVFNAGQIFQNGGQSVHAHSNIVKESWNIRRNVFMPKAPSTE